MMTTKKRRRNYCQLNLVVAAAVATLITGCGPPGGRQLKNGERRIQAGQPAEAIEPLEDAVRALNNAPAPIRAKALNLLGLAFQGSGRFDDADKAYNAALKLDRNNAAVDYNLGCLQIEKTNFPGAINYLATYTQLRPADFQGFLRLGTARLHSALEQRTQAERARLLEAARRDFQNADRISGSAEAANALGMIELQHRSPSLESIQMAAQEFALALKRDEHYGPAMLNLAIISQVYLNQPSKALKLYREYMALTPPPPNTNQVDKLAKDLDLKLRIIITPGAAPTRTAPATPPPVKSTYVPSNPPAVAQKTPPAQSPLPPTQPQTPPTSVQVSTSAPGPPANNPTPVTPPPETKPIASNPTSPAPPPSQPVSNGVALESPSPPVVTDTAVPPKKTLGQRINPLNWFSGKSKGGTADADPPPLPSGSRYEYPPAVTPIPGDRGQAKSLVADAVRARQDGSGAECIRDYKDATAADPTFYDAYYGLGLAAMDAHDYPTALEALHHALELQEDSADARYAFSWALQKRGYTEDAVHELSTLVTQHPNEARAHLLLGSLYAQKLHQPKLAREQFMATLDLDPKNPQADTIRNWLKSNP